MHWKEEIKEKEAWNSPISFKKVKRKSGSFNPQNTKEKMGSWPFVNSVVHRDQLARLFFNIWPFTILKSCPKFLKNAKVGSKFCQTHKPSTFCQSRIKIFPKVAKFRQILSHWLWLSLRWLTAIPLTGYCCYTPPPSPHSEYNDIIHMERCLTFHTKHTTWHLYIFVGWTIWRCLSTTLHPIEVKGGSILLVH